MVCSMFQRDQECMLICSMFQGYQEVRSMFQGDQLDKKVCSILFVHLQGVQGEPLHRTVVVVSKAVVVPREEIFAQGSVTQAH